MHNDIEPLKAQLARLKAQHAAGQLPDLDYERSKAATERVLLDLVLAPPAARSSHRGPVAIGAAVVAVVAAILGYAGATYWGQLQSAPTPLPNLRLPASDSGAPPQAPHGSNSAQINAMTDRLAARLKDDPDNAEGWAMLARSYGALGRFAQAQQAYQKAMALDPKNASLQADYKALSEPRKPQARSPVSDAMSSIR